MTSAASSGPARVVAPGLTPSGRAVVPAAWSLYDFANTIFSFAVVSGAIGLYLVNDRQFGERDGNLLLSIAIVVSVGLNALVSPILGAFSDRGGRRMPFLLFFTLLCIGATFFIADVPPILGLRPVHRRQLRLPGGPHLLRRDAQDRVSYPETRGKLSGIGTGIGYCGTVFVGLLIFFLDIAGRRPLPPDRRSCSSLFAIPIFLVRPRAAPSGRAAADAARHHGTRSASSGGRSRTPARSRACGGSWSAGSSTPMRSTRSSSS